MNPPDPKEPCPTCGHKVDERGDWHPTNDVRIVPVEGVQDYIGSYNHKTGIERGTLTMRTRTERAWIRTWGEVEWRAA